MELGDHTRPVTRGQLDMLLEFGRIGIRQLLEAQNRALAEAAVS